MIALPRPRPPRPQRNSVTVRDAVTEGLVDVTFSGQGTTGWDSEIALWELVVSRQPDLGEFACLQAPEVFAADVDVEDTLAARGMQPEPTYPPAPVVRTHWRENPQLAPHLLRYSVLLTLLESEHGVDAVYRWAGVRRREADAYALYVAGLTDEAIAEQLKIALPTVTEFVGRVDWRLQAALRHLDQVREADEHGAVAS